jgi:hydroxyacylglutathione hydrolase
VHAGRGVAIDPGEEPRRLLEAAKALGMRIEAILITHTHFDHIGAVAPVARETGAPVWCPASERVVLVDIASFTPPGFGPFESYEPQHTLAGGEHLELAGLAIEVLATPGHSPGHLTYAIGRAEHDGAQAQADATAARAQGEGAGEVALFSGDVLFQGSVGRVDLPGGEWPALERSIAALVERFPGQTRVYPGHMGATTLGRELESNPFLAELRGALLAGAAGAAGRAGGQDPGASHAGEAG